MADERGTRFCPLNELTACNGEIEPKSTNAACMECRSQRTYVLEKLAREKNFDLIDVIEEMRIDDASDADKAKVYTCPTDNMYCHDDERFLAFRDKIEKKCELVAQEDEFCRMCLEEAKKAGVCTDKGILFPRCPMKNPSYDGIYFRRQFSAAPGCNGSSLTGTTLCKSCWEEIMNKYTKEQNDAKRRQFIKRMRTCFTEVGKIRHS